MNGPGPLEDNGSCPEGGAVNKFDKPPLPHPLLEVCCGANKPVPGVGVATTGALVGVATTFVDLAIAALS